jgi:hypothetical protein
MARKLDLVARLLAAMALVVALHAQAGGVYVKSAELAPTEAGYGLDATVLGIASTSTR